MMGGRRNEWIIALVALVVGFETWWILARDPLAIVSEGQGEIILQGHGRPSSEQHPRDAGGGDGRARPPGGPPMAPHGPGASEGRRGGGAMKYGNGEGHPGPARPGGEDNSENRSGMGAPNLPRETGDRRDDYHKLLAGIMLLDAEGEISPDQARLLLHAIRAREALKGSAVPEAVQVIYPVLDNRQRAVVERVRADRLRQGKAAAPPEDVPILIRQVLQEMEGR